jgi:hypothetical protein
MSIHVKGEKREKRNFWAKQQKFQKRFPGEVCLEITKEKKPRVEVNGPWVEILVLEGLTQ